MEYRKGIILIILTIFLFSIASACAIDANDVQVAAEDNSGIELTTTENNLIASEDIVEVGVDGDAILKESEGSFVDLNNDINGNNNTTITLNKNYKYGDGDGDYANGIVINRPVTINGNGIVIDGSNNARVFNILGDNVIINNITFINGHAKGPQYIDKAGGAIYWTGNNGMLSNSMLINNKAEYSGAIMWDGNYGTIVNSTFEGNVALDGNAGAVQWYGAYGTITDSVLKNNSATDYGGALLWSGSNGLLANSTFINNKANYGGVVNWWAESGTVTRCIFIGNVAYAEGSVYYNDYDKKSYSKFNYNILLNNTAYDVFFDVIATSNMDYNWFGDGIYKINPHAVPQSINYLLTLNGTADPSEILLSNSSNITFTLSQDPNAGSSQYANAPFEKLYLTLAAANGYVNASSIKIGETVQFTPDNVGTGIVNATVVDVSYAVEITVKDDANLTVESQNMTFGEDAVITLNYNGSATGKVNITLEGYYNAYFYPNVDLNKTIKLADKINIDDYYVTVDYSGDRFFSKSTANAILLVSVSTVVIIKPNATVNASDIVFDYGSFGYTLVNLSGATGISAKIINQSNTVITTNDLIFVFGLDAGVYELEITPIANDTYDVIVTMVNITVNKLKTNLMANPITLVYGDSDDMVIALKDAGGNDLANRNITVMLNGEAYNVVTDGDGKASLTIPDILTAKTYTVSIIFDGEKNYNNATLSVDVTVKKATPKLTAKAKSFKKNAKTKKYTITLKTNKNKALKNSKVYLKVKGKTYSAKTNGKGQATFNIKKLTKKGTYKSTVTYKGNSCYNKVVKSVKITLK